MQPQSVVLSLTPCTYVYVRTYGVYLHANNIELTQDVSLYGLCTCATRAEKSLIGTVVSWYNHGVN